LAGYEGQKGLTIVPISVYNKGTKLKVRIAVARGKKARDKREDLKKKSVKRDIERLMKDR
jgi:SsrA-binding protein